MKGNAKMKMVKLLAAAGIVMAICLDVHAEKITPFMFCELAGGE